LPFHAYFGQNQMPRKPGNFIRTQADIAGV